MRIAVFSDSHGEYEKMAAALRGGGYDMVLHLGDYSRDAHELEAIFPNLPIKAVRGNCDMSSRDRDSDVLFAGDVKIYMTHGHKHQVKSGISRLVWAGREIGAHLVLFGHTHRALMETYHGIQFLNPGAVCDHRSPSYAQIDIASGGAMAIKIKHL